MKDTGLINQKKIVKWRSSLLLTVLGLLLFESLTGMVLFFFGSFLTAPELLIEAHWILGLVVLVPYAVYQWRHYFAVRQYARQLHYRLGLFTFFSLLVVNGSGVLLLFDLNWGGGLYLVVDLVHTASSFVFLMLLGGHLVLVARLTLQRINKKAQANTGALALIGRLPLWILLSLSGVVLTILLFAAL